MKVLHWILFATLTVSLFAANWARAEASLGANPTPNPKVVMKKSETHVFPGLALKGELKKPELTYFYERKSLRSEAIVNIPDNFNHEITEGAGQF